MTATALVACAVVIAPALATPALAATTTATAPTATAAPTATTSTTATNPTATTATTATNPTAGAIVSMSVRVTVGSPLTAAAHQRSLAPLLSWGSDSAAAYAHRLGAAPTFYGQSVSYPMAAADATNLRDYVEQIAAQGANAVLSIEPNTALASLTAADADAFAGTLKQLNARYGTDFLLRFAPEMNGNWNSWGQQPAAYVAAFRTFAAHVHDALPRSVAQLAWTPVYGAGYPFGTAAGRLRTDPASARSRDTDGNGVVDDADDPYKPYFPGTSAVDWVGLSVYDYGTSQSYGANVVPPAGKYAAMLAGRYQYQKAHGAGRDFVARYSTATHKPMMVETAALYTSGRTGSPSAQAIKQAWWRQVLAANTHVSLMVWLEQRRAEAETHGTIVDWRATGSTALAAAFHHDLSAAGFTLGTPARDVAVRATAAPTTAAPTGGARTSQAADSTAVHAGLPSSTRWTVLGIGTIVLGAAVLIARLRRRRTHLTSAASDE